MFSGLINEVSSWISSTKGNQKENVSAMFEEISADLGEKKEASNLTNHSKLEIFSNVKGQIEEIGGWFGSSIPKLRKGEDEQVPVPDKSLFIDENEEENGLTSEKSVNGSPPALKDGDNSSTIGETPPGLRELPIEKNKDDQFGTVQIKAFTGAKSFESFLYSAVNTAGKTVSEVSAKIKETVEKYTILGEFNKEQETFAKNQAANATNALPPWIGCYNEELLKEECLILSTDKRNFIRSPPVDFQFDYKISYPIAMAIMKQDPKLEKLRYELVPKVISEENFWKNYFYRVNLICQANEVSSRKGNTKSADIGSERPLAQDTNTDALTEDFGEVQEGMKKIALGSKPEEDWEMEVELQDFQVVSELTSHQV